MSYALLVARCARKVLDLWEQHRETGLEQFLQSAAARCLLCVVSSTRKADNRIPLICLFYEQKNVQHPFPPVPLDQQVRGRLHPGVLHRGADPPHRMENGPRRWQDCQPRKRCQDGEDRIRRTGHR